MKKILRFFTPETVLVIVILLFAAFIRLWRISEYLTFLGDEGRDVMIVRHMIVDHKFTLLGPTASVGGFFLGPVYYYFMIPFLWLWRMDPTGPAVMVALFGVATVYLCYLVGKRMFSTTVGILASVLYAISPVVIAYSRSSWNPNPVPFFTLLLIYSLWLVSVSKRERWVILAGFSIGIGMQLHYLFSFMGIMTVCWLGYLMIIRIIPVFRSILKLIIGFIIGNSLFLLFEIRHGFPNTISIVRFITTGKDTGFNLYHFGSTIISVIFRLFARLIFRYPDHGVLENLPIWQVQIWTTVINVSILTSLFFLIYEIYRNSLIYTDKFKKNISGEFFSTRLMLFWLIIPLILFGFYQRDIYDYYLGILFPLPFLLVSIVGWILSKQKIGLVTIILIFSGLVYFNWLGRPFIYEPNNQLGQAKSIAKFAIEKTDGQPFNFALLAGQNTDHSYRYFFELWGNAPKTIENFMVDPGRKSVTNQLIVICEIPDCKPLGNSLWEIAGFGRAEIVAQWNVSFVTIYKLIHYVK